MSGSGFHGDIATSHLPEHVKQALLDYQERHVPESHGKLTEWEYSMATFTWSYRYTTQSPKGRLMDAREWNAQIHTATPDHPIAK